LHVEAQADGATLRLTQTDQWPGGHYTTREVHRLRRTRQGWRTYARRAWPAQSREGSVLTVYDEAVWKDLDAVVVAEPEGSAARVTALEKALRLVEAHAEAKKRTAGAAAGWEDWVVRARTALWIEEVNDVRLAVQRAWKLGAKRPLMPQLEAAMPAPRR
jgi:hypothetical protein